MKNFIKIALISTLILSINQNLFSCGNFFEEKEELNKLSQRIFFEQNPWLFVKLKLVEKPNKKSNNLWQKLIGGGIGIGAAFLAGNLVGQTTESTNLTIATSVTALIVSEYFYKKFIREYFYIQALTKYLDRYNSATYNYKQYTPKELQLSVDILYEKYQKGGKKAIEKDGLNLIKEIKDLKIDSVDLNAQQKINRLINDQTGKGITINIQS